MKQINAMTHLAYLQFKANTPVKQLLCWAHILCLIPAIRHILANILDIISKSSGEVDASDTAKHFCCTFQRIYLLLRSEKHRVSLPRPAVVQQPPNTE